MSEIIQALIDALIVVVPVGIVGAALAVALLRWAEWRSDARDHDSVRNAMQHSLSRELELARKAQDSIGTLPSRGEPSYGNRNRHHTKRGPGRVHWQGRN